MHAEIDDETGFLCCPATAREMNDRPHHGVDAASPVIRVLDTDPATFDLLNEWLTSAGFAVANANDRGAAALMIVDVPFTRHGGRDVVQRASTQYPGTPVLALSPTFFSNVECGGQLCAFPGRRRCAAQADRARHADRHCAEPASSTRMNAADGLVAATARQLTRRTVAWGGGLLIAVIVAMAAFDIVRSYRATVEDTGRELETQARIVAEQMGRSVQGVDVVLRHIAAEFNRGRLSKLTPAELHAYLGEQAVGLVQVDGIAMHDAKGDALAISWLPLGAHVNIAHFEGFPAVRDDPKAGLFVSAATRSPTDQRWVFPLLRRLETPSGEFGGIVGARGRIDYLAAVLSRRSSRPGHQDHADAPELDAARALSAGRSCIGAALSAVRNDARAACRGAAGADANGQSGRWCGALRCDTVGSRLPT